MSFYFIGKSIQLYQSGSWQDRGHSAWGTGEAFKGLLYKERVGVDPPRAGTALATVVHISPPGLIDRAGCRETREGERTALVGRDLATYRDP